MVDVKRVAGLALHMVMGMGQLAPQLKSALAALEGPPAVKSSSDNFSVENVVVGAGVLTTVKCALADYFQLLNERLIATVTYSSCMVHGAQAYHLWVQVLEEDPGLFAVFKGGVGLCTGNEPQLLCDDDMQGLLANRYIHVVILKLLKMEKLSGV